MINRLDKVKDILTNEQCTHILVTDSIDAEYVSGFHSSNVTLLISQKQNISGLDFNMDVSSLNTGIYLIQISDKNAVWNSKFIKE